MVEKNEGKGCGGQRDVERDGVEWSAIGGDGKAPGKFSGKACIVSLREVAKGEEGPYESCAGAPGIEGVKQWELANAEVDDRDKDGKKDAGGSEGGHHEEKDGVGEEFMEVGEDEEETGETEG